MIYSVLANYLRHVSEVATFAAADRPSIMPAYQHPNPSCEAVDCSSAAMASDFVQSSQHLYKSNLVCRSSYELDSNKESDCIGQASLIIESRAYKILALCGYANTSARR